MAEPRLARPFWMVAMLLVVRGAAAQPDQALTQARALFDEALADERHGDAAVALDKFERVAHVRDTAQVEFRIASCLETLGQRRRALIAFARSTQLATGDADARDVADSANDHIAKLSARLGRVDLTIRGTNARNAVVSIDGQALGASESGSPLFLDPGSHEVDVTAAGAKPAHATVAVAEGARASVTLTLDAASVESPPAAPVDRSSAFPTQGLIVAGVGAALLIGSAVSLAIRGADISTINADCPASTCPASRRDEIEGLRSTATALGPVWATLGVLGLIGVGVGTISIAIGSAPARPSAWIAPGGAGLLGVSGGYSF